MLVLRQIPHEALGNADDRFTFRHIELSQHLWVSNCIALNYILA
jgi:hypothetical protein